METFSIAKLNVRFEAAGDLLFTRTRAYLAPKQDAEADITIDLPESLLICPNRSLKKNIGSFPHSQWTSVVTFGWAKRFTRGFFATTGF